MRIRKMVAVLGMSVGLVASGQAQRITDLLFSGVGKFPTGWSWLNGTYNLGTAQYPVYYTFDPPNFTLTDVGFGSYAQFGTNQPEADLYPRFGHGCEITTQVYCHSDSYGAEDNVFSFWYRGDWWGPDDKLEFGLDGYGGWYIDTPSQYTWQFVRIVIPKWTSGAPRTIWFRFKYNHGNSNGIYITAVHWDGISNAPPTKDPPPHR